MKIRYNNEIVELKLSHLIEYGFLHLFRLVFSLIPLSWETRLSGPISEFLFLLDRKHRERAVANLSNAFPALAKTEILRLGRQVFASLVSMVFEFIHLRKLSSRKYIERHIRRENIGVLDSLLAKGKGLIAVTAHLGNWELEGSVTCSLGYTLNALYFQQSNFLADSFFNAIRRKAGIRLIYRKNALRNVLQALSRNEIVAFLADQDNRRDGVFVDFFGRPASTARGPAYFALKTGAPIVFTWLVRTGKTGYEFGVREVEVSTTGDFEKDLTETTARWSRVLEEIVRKYPEQWFWVHRRWKTRPKAAA